MDSYPLLQNLDVSSSEIMEVEDDALGRLEILVTLNLGYNQMTRIPTSLPSSLVHLYLQHNQITDIQPSTFVQLTNLEMLNLSGNKITYLPGLPLPKLLTLNLRTSGLKRLSQSVVKFSPNLKDLLLDGNPLKCSELLGVAEWATPCRSEKTFELVDTDPPMQRMATTEGDDVLKSFHASQNCLNHRPAPHADKPICTPEKLITSLSKKLNTSTGGSAPLSEQDNKNVDSLRPDENNTVETTSNDKISHRLMGTNDIGLANKSMGLSPNNSVAVALSRSGATIATNNGSNIASHLIENDVKLNVQNNKAPSFERRKGNGKTLTGTAMLPIVEGTKPIPNEVAKSNKKDVFKISDSGAQSEHSSRNIDMYANKKNEVLKNHFRIINTKLDAINLGNAGTVAAAIKPNTSSSLHAEPIGTGTQTPPSNEIDSKKSNASRNDKLNPATGSPMRSPAKQKEVKTTTQAALANNAKPADVIASSKRQPNGNQAEQAQQSRTNERHYKNGTINWTTNKAISHEDNANSDTKQWAEVSTSDDGNNNINFAEATNALHRAQILDKFVLPSKDKSSSASDNHLRRHMVEIGSINTGSNNSHAILTLQMNSMENNSYRMTNNSNKRYTEESGHADTPSPAATAILAVHNKAVNTLTNADGKLKASSFSNNGCVTPEGANNDGNGCKNNAAPIGASPSTTGAATIVETGLKLKHHNPNKDKLIENETTARNSISATIPAHHASSINVAKVLNVNVPSQAMVAAEIVQHTQTIKTAHLIGNNVNNDEDAINNTGALNATPEQWNDLRISGNHPGLFVIIAVISSIVVSLGLIHIYRCRNPRRRRRNRSEYDDDHEQYPTAHRDLLTMDVLNSSSIHYADTPIDMW